MTEIHKVGRCVREIKVPFELCFAKKNDMNEMTWKRFVHLVGKMIRTSHH